MPYGALVRQVLGSIPADAKQSQFLFPARFETMRGKPTTIFNAWSKSKAPDKELKGVEPYKLHDLRRTFATTLQGLGVPLEVREKL